MTQLLRRPGKRRRKARPWGRPKSTISSRLKIFLSLRLSWVNRNGTISSAWTRKPWARAQTRLVPSSSATERLQRNCNFPMSLMPIWRNLVSQMRFGKLPERWSITRWSWSVTSRCWEKGSARATSIPVTNCGRILAHSSLIWGENCYSPWSPTSHHWRDLPIGQMATFKSFLEAIHDFRLWRSRRLTSRENPDGWGAFLHGL